MSYHGHEVVVFCIDTTGLHPGSEICRITAYSGQIMFNTYVLPTSLFAPGASQVNDMQFEYDGYYNYLTHHGRRVNACTPRDAMIQFVSYLQHFGRPVVLLAHGAYNFHIPRILNLAKEVDMTDEFVSVADSFNDTLELARQSFSNRREPQLRYMKFDLSSLASRFLPNLNFNSMSKPEILYELLPHIGITYEKIMGTAWSLKHLRR